MPSTQAIRAGRAFVELFADDSKLVRGLRAAQRKLKRFGSNVRALGLKMAGIGSAVLAPLAASAKVFSSYGDQVAKMAKRTGLSAEALSEMQFVASQTGTNFESLEMGFRRMQRSIYDAGRGLSTATDALSDLGLAFSDLDGLSPEEQFKLLADRISQVEDPTRKAAIAMTLFGRTGTNLLPMFAQGAQGIEELQQEARRLGLTMSSKDAAAAEDFTDVLDRLWKVVKMGTFRIGAALAPALSSLAETITGIIVTAGAWINQNRQIVITVAKVAAGVVAAGLALVAFGTIISTFAGALGGLITVVTTVSGVFGTLISVVGFLVSPIGLVITAVAALGAYIVYATGAGAKALAWLSEKFNALKEDALAAFGGIGDALAAGDIGLAMKILWPTLKMEWTRGIGFLEKAWLDFRSFFLRIGYDAWHGMLALVEEVWGAIEIGWMETTSFFTNIWNKVLGSFAKLWQNMIAIVKKAWNWIKGVLGISSRESVDRVNQEIERARQAAIAKIDDKQRREQARREAARQRQREQHRATLAQIGTENLAKQRQLDEEHAKRVAENEAELAAARREWQDAIKAARKKRAAKEAAADTGPGKLEEPANILDQLSGVTSGLGGLLSEQVAKIGARGTFNAASLAAFQAGGATDRMANGIDKIERNTRPFRNADALTFA